MHFIFTSDFYFSTLASVCIPILVRLTSENAKKTTYNILQRDIPDSAYFRTQKLYKNSWLD